MAARLGHEAPATTAARRLSEGKNASVSKQSNHSHGGGDDTCCDHGQALIHITACVHDSPRFAVAVLLLGKQPAIVHAPKLDVAIRRHGRNLALSLIAGHAGARDDTPGGGESRGDSMCESPTLHQPQATNTTAYVCSARFTSLGSNSGNHTRVTPLLPPVATWRPSGAKVTQLICVALQSW